MFLLVGEKLVPLTEADQLRSGTVVDTRNGSLQLTTASSQKHKRQTGMFGGAIFKLTQVHSRPDHAVASRERVLGRTLVRELQR